MTLETTKITKRTPGPRTPEGKSVSASNAVKHGVLSERVPQHEKTAFDAHSAALFEALLPVGAVEKLLADRIALTTWRLRRLEVCEAAEIAVAQRELDILNFVSRSSEEIQASAALLSETSLARLTRYEAHIERCLYRALHELEALQDRRQGKNVPLARVELYGDPVTPEKD
jgi:hypothetical protein